MSFSEKLLAKSSTYLNPSAKKRGLIQMKKYGYYLKTVDSPFYRLETSFIQLHHKRALI